MLRNPEFKRFLLLLLLCAAVGITAAFIVSPAAGIISSLLCVLLISLFVIYTHRRYTQIGHLSAYLKRINSGDYSLDVRDNIEGELSILKSEIYKVTVMLREQNDTLSKEKAALQNALSDISHQLKTPLTSMFMMTDLLCDAELPDEKRRAFTDRLRAQLERIQWLVSSLLKFSKLDAKTIQFKCATVSAEKLLEKACAPMQIPMEIKNQTLDLHHSSVLIRCDENWTAEALVNILKNCIEYTPEGGQIRISCSDNPIFTQIRIEDSGPGIDSKDLPHIFSRFYRGKNASDDSVGIGLAMASAIIKGQSGTIDASSRAGAGSTFTVRFPK